MNNNEILQLIESNVTLILMDAENQHLMASKLDLGVNTEESEVHLCPANF